MSRNYEENALMQREEKGGEISPNAGGAAAMKEIEVAMIVAQRFPRDEERCSKAILKACSRPRFADDVNYTYQRGKKEVGVKGADGKWVKTYEDNIITGLSIAFAREAARVWGNIIYRQVVINDTADSITIEGNAWDLQTNATSALQATIPKLVKRKSGDKVPSAREMLELVNMTGSKLKRNAILDLLPSDLKEEAGEIAEQTKISDAKNNPETAKRKLMDAFQSINISVEMLETYLTHSVDAITPEEIAKLRGIYKAVKDGTPWSEYVKPEAVETPTGTLNVEDLKPGGENRGHGEENLDQKTDAPAIGQRLLLDAVEAAADVLTKKEITDALELYGGKTVAKIPEDKCVEAADYLTKKANAKRQQ